MEALRHKGGLNGSLGSTLGAVVGGTLFCGFLFILHLLFLLALSEGGSMVGFMVLMIRCADA